MGDSEMKKLHGTMFLLVGGVGLALGMGGVSCMENDPNHCWWQQGDLTCSQIHKDEEGPWYCSHSDAPCSIKTDEFGCTQEEVMGMCRNACGEERGGQEGNCGVADGGTGDGDGDPGDGEPGDGESGDGDPGDGDPGDGDPGDGDSGDGDPGDGDVCNLSDSCSPEQIHTGQLLPSCVTYSGETNTVTVESGLSISTAINVLNARDTGPAGFHHLVIHPKTGSSPYTESPIEITKNMVINDLTEGTNRVAWKVSDPSAAITIAPGVAVYLINTNLLNSAGGGISLTEASDSSAIHLDRSSVIGKHYALSLGINNNANVTSSFLTSTNNGMSHAVLAGPESTINLNHSTIFSNHGRAIHCIIPEENQNPAVVTTTGFSAFSSHHADEPIKNCQIPDETEVLSTNSDDTFPFTGLTGTGDLHIDWSMHLDEPSLITPPHTPPSCDIDTDPFPTEDIRFGADQP